MTMRPSMPVANGPLSSRMRAVRGAGLSLLLVAAPSAAQVVPDGATTTSVTTDPTSGVATVTIAPTPNSSGISHNTYSSFSVPAAGVNLDNRSVNARTILNEVTSSRISNLNGPVEVLGARAHVIIANPNGIVVDGAGFLNTGGVVLSTGVPSIVTRQTLPEQDNVVLETASGTVEVGPNGLSGAMSSLQLIAGRIRVDGPIENTSSLTRSDLRLIAGNTSVEYDSGVLPNSDLEGWGNVTEQEGTDEGIAVEITERGSLKANTIRIRASNAGAGVSHAGVAQASSGDFIIDASGKVTTRGSVKASNNVKISAASIDSRSTAGRPQQRIEAVDGALALLAATGDIRNTGVLMSGSRRDETDPTSAAGVTLAAAGDIALLSERPDQLAIVFSASDDLVAEADGDIVNDTGRFLSNGAARLTAGGAIDNVTNMVAHAGTIGEWVSEVRYGKSLWYTFWQDRAETETVGVTYGDPRITGQQAYIVGESVVLDAGGAVTNRASTINANDGSVEIAARSIVNEALFSGSLFFSRTCAFVCTGYGHSDIALVGGGINATGDITLTAGERILNKGGQILGYGTTVLSARRVETQALRVPAVYHRPSGLYNFWSGSSAWLAVSDQGGYILAPQASVTINAFEPIEVKAGVIEARDGLIISEGESIVTPPWSGYPLGKAPIGLFGKLTGG